MRNKLLFLSRLFVTVIVAGILSAVVFAVISFILGNFGLYQEYFLMITAVTNTVFGLIIGYKLNDLLRESKR